MEKDMTERQSYLVVGSGIAGATAVELLRAEEPDAEVVVIADDAFPVYYRPALKDYLGGKLPRRQTVGKTHTLL